MEEGKYTLETFAESRGLTLNSALNLLSKLKRQCFVKVSGGGKQKRIYTVSNLKLPKTNGFYDIVNKYSKNKLVPRFKHKVFGKYTVENAIVDGLSIGDQRTLFATMHLFRHVTNWKRLFELAAKKSLKRELISLYKKARQITKIKAMPRRYL